MSETLYSVEQVAQRLGLNVRTVRGYVREGKLKAVRIGKQYRIARDDLEAMTGQPAPPPVAQIVRRHRHVEVSSIVQVDAIDIDTSSRLTNVLMASAQGRGSDDQPLRIETIYDAERARLKIVVLGGLSSTAALSGLIALYLER
ncbi:MAG TPA: helix-turn-helix domain-containing protein [Steroidobacteraceae bacterium]|jgi:excisionase family DNA binding protein|nr:helix-turn-helix domain-containing protein [Steroidobacteraceae bacterium]